MGSARGRRESKPKRVDREIEAAEGRPGVDGWMGAGVPPHRPYN